MRVCVDFLCTLCVDAEELLDSPSFCLCPVCARAVLCAQADAGKNEGFLRRLTQTAVPKVRQRVRKPVPETRCVDLFLLLRVLVMEYREEQAHR